MAVRIFFCLRRQQPESAKDPLAIAVEKWEKKLQKAKSAQDYLPFMLSNLVSIEKARTLYKVANGKSLPDNLFQNPDGVEKVARQLLRAGLSDLCRLLWYFVYHQKEHGDNFMGWCQAMMAFELRGRCVVQGGVYELDMLRSKREQLPPKERAEIESAIRELEKRFEGLADANHGLYRVLWQLQEHMPPGPLHGAFLAWRSNPDWYLCDWFRHRASRGHCTPACSYCSQTHGETDDDLDDEKWDNLGKFFEEKDNMYDRSPKKKPLSVSMRVNHEDEEESNCDAWLLAAKKTMAGHC